jgi:hypothetical protein
MADVRCPICGQINTSEAEACVFCGTRLKPGRSLSSGANREAGQEETADNRGEDWLSSLRLENEANASQASSDTPGQASADELPESDIPDWLSRIRARAQQETEEQAGAEDEAPEWMSGLQSMADRGGAAEGPDSPQPGQPTETPAIGSQAAGPGEAPVDNSNMLSTPKGEQWLDNLSAWQASNENESSASDSLPDWLNSESAPGEMPSGDLGPGQESPESFPEANAEDWLAEFGDEGIPDEQEAGQLATGESKPPESESSAGEQQGEPISAAPGTAEEMPEWLREFSSQEPGESGTVPPLIETEGLEPNAAELEPGADFAAGALPEWLSEESAPSADSQEVEKAGEPDGEELAHAELPEWVKEMRPIESALPGEMDATEPGQQVEQAGPLAGVRGILPMEELNTLYRKPPVYSGKLRLSEKQHNHASLLESIIAQETLPLLIPHERPHVSQVFPRILITLLLFAVLLSAHVFPLGLAPGSLLAPPELDDMFNQIEQIGQHSPVLLAVDFEPGRFSEMYFASLPVIEHLMAKNASLVVLSTTPTGPALAQRLLEEAARDLGKRTEQAYDPAAQSLNLGYLPGGTISLLEFAQTPSRAAPATLEGNFDIWSQSFLKDVKTLGGFSQVIVLTDSAETGRAWIEQVKPLMGDAPLLMVTSAQAAPLLMPYVQSQQINGMVSGFLGGVTYGQWRHVDTPASEYWGSYQIGTVLAIVVIVIGGLFSFIKAQGNRKEKGEE